MKKLNREQDFTKKYTEWYPKLVAYAHKRLMNKSNAPDVVQDVFYKFLKYSLENPTKRISVYILRKNIDRLVKDDNEVSKRTEVI